ncbi:MAG: potassium transporter TrkG [Bdellovibrionota bacterium]
MATLAGALFCMMLIPSSKHPFSYKRMLLTGDASVLVSFGLASLLYALFLIDSIEQNGLLFMGGLLAFLSVVFIGSAKLRLDARLVYAVIFGILGLGLYCVYQNPGSSHFGIASTVYGLCVLTALAALILARSKSAATIGYRFFSQPEVIIISFFAAFAAIGAILLQMPLAQAQSAPHPFVDSFFTAMSAVCVTGLIVLDTPVDFSLFGQGVILMLIQVGGIGIVSLSAWVLFVFQSKRLSIHHEQAITELSAYKHSISPKQMIKRILAYFFAFEMVGAFVLFFAFMNMGDGGAKAAWRAIFTAISAFCNAGFAIQSDSLIPYQSSFLVMFTISLLIIAGGFAPLLVLGLPKKKFRRWSLQEKISIFTTLILLSAGTILFLLLEWGHSMNDLGTMEKLSNAWFQSVTTRTAGFNSVDLTAMRDVTTIFFMMLMFVGGNPGSAAGGIKTVTAAVIFFATVSALRSGKEVRAFSRSIRVEVVNKAIAIAILGLATGFFAYLTLAMTQQIETIPLLFETVSALGTVGLSLGVTGSLDGVGKIIIIFCMLAGRVGPVTFVLTLLRNTPQSKWEVPQEDVYVS